MDRNRMRHIPDSVLCQILSFLPTKTAVTTSILSRRWRHLWEHLQVFNFSNVSFRNYKCFAFFVYSVLAMRKMRDIQKFYLSSDQWIVDHITMWIRAATGPYLQELQLSLNPLYSVDPVPIPLSLFTCTGLVKLNLYGAIRVEKLQSVYLPSLKTFIVNIEYLGPVDTFFSGCPVLETLDFTLNEANVNDEPNPTKIRVPSTLKRLTFADRTVGLLEDLEINSPSLEYLSIFIETSCSHLSLTNLQNVVKAHLHYEEEVDQSEFAVLKLLRQLTRTQVLSLHHSTFEMPPILDFPEFAFLLRLELTLPYVCPELVNLLQKCGILQVFKIQLEDRWSLGSWTQPINDPNCVGSHLMIFECRRYQGYASQHAFIAYVLQRGLVLKTMTIHTHHKVDLMKKHHILKQLSTIPRASNMCQLNFD